MNDIETKQAADALVQWFNSQSIMPADAGMVMSRVIAVSLTRNTRDVRKLQQAVDLFKLMIVCDVALELKA